MPARRKQSRISGTAAVRLTPSERTVSEWLGEDCTYAEIAAKLGLGHDTVRGHARAILRKLGVRTRHAAVARHLLGGAVAVPRKSGSRKEAPRRQVIRSSLTETA